MTSQRIKALSEMNLEQFKATCRFGWELETETIPQTVEESVEESVDVRDMAEKHYDSRNEWASFSDLIEEAQERYIEDYHASYFNVGDHIDDHIDTSEDAYYADCRVDTDSSVRGVEITLATPQNYLDSLRVARNLFSELAKDSNLIEISSNCSFHVHVSVEDVSHSWSREFQKALQFYTALQYHTLDAARYRLPHAVERYAQWGNLEEDDKYSAVRFHRDYRTWEFRVFGAINSYDDVVRAHDIVASAMLLAYKDKVEGVEIPDEIFAKLMRDMISGMPREYYVKASQHIQAPAIEEIITESDNDENQRIAA